MFSFGFGLWLQPNDWARWKYLVWKKSSQIINADIYIIFLLIFISCLLVWFPPPLYLHCDENVRAVPGSQPGCQWSNFSWPWIWFTSVGWIKPFASPELSRDFWKLVWCTCSEFSKKFYFPSPEHSKKLVVLVPRPEFSGNIPFPSLVVPRNSWHLQERKTASTRIRSIILLFT